MPNRPNDDTQMKRNLATLASFSRAAGAGTPWRPSRVTKDSSGYHLPADLVQLLDEQFARMSPGVAVGRDIPVTDEVRAALAMFGYTPIKGGGGGSAGSVLSDPRKKG